jgi:hypothetical protein
MRKIILACLLLLLNSFVAAQTTGKDVIYLKNGSVLHGTIIEEQLNVSVTIKISEETVMVIAIEDIKDVNHQKAISQENAPKKMMKLNLTPKTGVYKIVQLRGGQAFTSISASAGYNYKRHAFGVGAAFQPYLNIGAITPVYAEYRYEIGKKEKRIKPMVLGQIGYGFPVINQNARRDTIQGGLYWNVGFGYKEYTARKFQWVYGIVFLQQTTHEIWDERQQNWNEATQEFVNINVHFDTQKLYNRVILSWGLWF